MLQLAGPLLGKSAAGPGSAADRSHSCSRCGALGRGGGADAQKKRQATKRVAREAAASGFTFVTYAIRACASATCHTMR